MTPRQPFRLPVSLLALGLAALGVGALATGMLDTGKAQAQGAAPQAMPVSVAPPAKRQVIDWLEFPGRFLAMARVEIRPQVAGKLESVEFTDGQRVKAGDVLAKIDPREFQAALDQTLASVQANKTKLDLATADLKRAQDLLKTGNIPQATFQSRQQTFLEAQANLAASEAGVATARLNVEYSTIRAPISGRIGRKLITEGNLLTAGSQGSLLTTIVQDAPIYFYFDVDEQSFLTYKRESGGDESAKGGEPNGKAFVRLADETTFSHPAEIDFIDNAIADATGTIRFRAILKNEDGLITPGQFGRIKMATGKPHEALIVPEAAIMPDQTRHIVMVVDKEGTVKAQPVDLGPLYGEWRVIDGGLKGDESIIVNGLMRARPGGKVIPQPTELKVPADLTTPNAAQNG
jgi:RND family efflux transporter MFP subunit